jgi:ribonuclease HI
MKAEIYSDGSCLGNPGPGGWATLIRYKNKIYRIQGGEPETTNNRMEMLAALNGLRAVFQNFDDVKEIEVYSDSSLLINTMSKGWKRKANLDLWEQFLPVLDKGAKISWHWVKGHAGHKENEDCDKRAMAEAIKQARLA